jgi:hypothetical protein
VEIVVTGRNVEVPEHFRVHVTEKVERLERYDHKIVGLEVELFHERNRRQLKNCQRVKVARLSVRWAEACARRTSTPRSTRRSPSSRPECGAPTTGAASPRPLDRAGRPGRWRSDPAVGRAGDVDVDVEVPGPRDALDVEVDTPSDPVNGSVDAEVEISPDDADAEFDEHRPGRIVRRKVHTAHPMSVDDALSRMELVGHDFYLFSDSETGAPSVVYRRKGYDYGVIRLSH